MGVTIKPNVVKYIDADGTEKTITAIKGEKGDKGDTGDTGGLFYPEFTLDASTGILSVSGVSNSAIAFTLNTETGNLEVNTI